MATDLGEVSRRAPVGLYVQAIWSRQSFSRDLGIGLVIAVIVLAADRIRTA